jgi:hypothetical protein
VGFNIFNRHALGAAADMVDASATKVWEEVLKPSPSPRPFSQTYQPAQPYKTLFQPRHMSKLGIPVNRSTLSDIFLKPLTDESWVSHKILGTMQREG